MSVVEVDVLEAFSFLNARRPVQGLGFPGAISLTEIREYCAIYHIEDVAYFSDLISEIDVRFLSMMGEKDDG